MNWGQIGVRGSDGEGDLGAVLWHVTEKKETPASLLGIKKGKIAEGYDADLLIINDDMTIGDVIISGKRYL